MGKLAKLIVFAVVVFVAYVVNYYLLKIAMFQFTGIILGAIIVVAVVGNIVMKIKNKKNKEADDNSFILPKGVAKKMGAATVGIQYEASILSLSFLIVGMALFSVYFVFFTAFDWLFKGFYIFNAVCGMILMASMLVTNYQQYLAWKESQTLISEFGASSQSKGEIVMDFPIHTNNHKVKGGTATNGKR